MTTITQRKKLSKGTWALIFILIAVLIAVAVLAAVGIIDLGFLTADFDMETNTAGLLVSYAMFGADGWINALIIIIIPFAVGMIFCFGLYRYFIGQKVTTTMQTGGYNPLPTTPSQTQKDTETVIT
jgi:flagellar basal body-associated protein FliL